MKLIIALAVLLVAANALHASEFEAWQKQFGKQYTSQAEHSLRLKVFSSNLDMINSWNAEHTGENDVQLAINQFADITNSEYRQTLAYSGRVPRRASESHKRVGAELPDQVDWRENGNVISPVKNQGSCGSCWAFSAVGAMEPAWAKKYGELVQFSEQQLVDCAGGQYGNEGCNGGLMSSAMDYILDNGAMTGADYGYKGKNQKCMYDAAKAKYHFAKYVNITEGSEVELQEAIAFEGPVAVAIDASHFSFQFYKSGIYKEKSCKNKDDDLDHGVVAIGYGYTGTDPKNKDNQYYIVRNSWGGSWGLKGYIWMQRNNNNACGIATCSEYPIA